MTVELTSGAAVSMATGNVSYWLESNATLATPRTNVTGYYNLTTRNRDGGWGVAVDAIFYTDDCPFEGSLRCGHHHHIHGVECMVAHDTLCSLGGRTHTGMWGRGLDCAPCPEGADCPGGYRLWPRPGWWNYHEFSGIVGRCNPPEACLGGRFHLCAPGYTGDFCSQCEPDFYQLNSRCVPCEPPSFIALLYSIQGGFVVLLLIAVLVASEKVVSHVEFVLGSLQYVISSYRWVVRLDPFA